MIRASILTTWTMALAAVLAVIAAGISTQCQREYGTCRLREQPSFERARYAQPLGERSGDGPIYKFEQVPQRGVEAALHRTVAAMKQRTSVRPNITTFAPVVARMTRMVSRSIACTI